jgi:catechol 2,3-dioxygenase-like lactoylglutathione lyase family enzyme
MASPYLRLRQICLVAADLEKAVDDLTTVLGIEVCHRDPNVGRYGLVNALMPVGTNFLEVVAPAPGKAAHETAAGRYLQRRKGDGGYMVIMDADDVQPWRARMAAKGVRMVEVREYPGKAFLTQMHPRDTGGAIMEIDHHIGGDDPMGHYQWAGDHWQGHVCLDRTIAMTGVELQADRPEALAKRWADLLDRPLSSGTVKLDNAALAFVTAADGRGEGLGGVEIAVADIDAVKLDAQKRGLPISGDTVTICGTRFAMVAA